MTFEGLQIQGAVKIIEKLTVSIPPSAISRIHTYEIIIRFTESEFPKDQPSHHGHRFPTNL